MSTATEKQRDKQTAMYEYINGTIAEMSPTHVVLDVSGVGYYIHISLQTYSAIERLDRASCSTGSSQPASASCSAT